MTYSKTNAKIIILDRYVDNDILLRIGGVIMKKACCISAVLILCIVIFATFVACNEHNDNTKEKAIDLTSDMTADQIRAALKDVKNFTMVVKNDTEIRYVQKWFESGYSETETNNGGNYAFLVENNRQYEFYWDDGTVEKRVIDCSGYDTYKTNYCKTYIERCLDLLDEGWAIQLKMDNFVLPAVHILQKILTVRKLIFQPNTSIIKL